MQLLGVFVFVLPRYFGNRRGFLSLTHRPFHDTEPGRNIEDFRRNNFARQGTSGNSYFTTCLIDVHPPVPPTNLTSVPLTLPVAVALTQPVVAWQWVA